MFEEEKSLASDFLTIVVVVNECRSSLPSLFAVSPESPVFRFFAL